MVSLNKKSAFVFACVAVCVMFSVFEVSKVTTIDKTPIATQEQNGVWDFDSQWSRMHRWRVDWESMILPCKNKMAWDERQPSNSTERTDAYRSYISQWEIMPAGLYSRFYIQSVTKDGRLKKRGGDAWRVYIRQGPASLMSQIWDKDDGLYEVVFLVVEPGNYSVQVILDHTLCDGLRDPPLDWLRKGDAAGKEQPEGTLGYTGEDFIWQRLRGEAGFRFFVPNGDNKTGFHSPRRLNGQSNCRMLHDGFGRWVDKRWLPFIPESSSSTECERTASQPNTLWIYGDSLSYNLYHSIIRRGICKEVFRKCNVTFLYLYKFGTKLEDVKDGFNKTVVLQGFADMLQSPEMNSPNSVVMFNLGIHYSMGLSFAVFKDLLHSLITLVKENASRLSNNSPTFVWKTASAIEEPRRFDYKGLKKSATMWRFYTAQRLMLFSMYATSAMCRAGINVLDTYPMTASFHTGTQDGVHYHDDVQKPAEDELVKFVTRKIKCI